MDYQNKSGNDGVACLRISKMKKPRLTPQEKKVLSYQKDCQNVYGENDKGSRKSIPKRKALANRKIRLSSKADLKAEIEGRKVRGNFERNMKQKWKKTPDSPLGERLEWREDIPIIGRNRNMKSDLRKEAVKRLRKSR